MAYTKRNSNKNMREDAEIKDTASKEESRDTRKYNSNKQRRNTKRGKGSRADHSYPKSSADNDISWYARNPQMLLDVASVPFSYAVGLPYDLTSPTSVIGGGAQSVTDRKQAVPGIMKLSFVPTPGISNNSASALNQASVNLYSFVRKANSGSRNYDHADLTMFVLAMDSLMTLHAHLMRAYGIARRYTPMNRYYPLALIQAMNLDPMDLVQNMAQWRYTINQLAYQLSQFVLPAGITYLDRHRWMSSVVLLDEPDVKAQQYIYVPSGFWKWDNTASTGSNLTLMTWTDYIGTTDKTKAAGSTRTLANLADVQAMIDDLVKAVSGDEDIAIMCGDVMKATGQYYALPVCPEDYKVDPGYSMEALSQIENAVVLGCKLRSSDKTHLFTITQDPSVNSGAILFDPVIWLNTDVGSGSIDLTYATDARMLNMHLPNPTPADVMIATRLAVNIRSVGNVAMPGSTQATPAFKFVELGSEFISSAQTYTLFNGQIENLQYANRPILRTKYNANAGGPANQSVTVTDISTFVRQIVMTTQFEHAPMLQPSYINSQATTTYFNEFGFASNICNYTVMQPDTLASIHQVAMWSMLNAQAAVVDTF